RKMETLINSTNSQSEALIQMQSSIQNSVLLMATAVSHNENPAKFSGQNFEDLATENAFLFDHVELGQIF
ncbi:hypothetical protein J1N35_038337, partial [Gossypium stocksii]